MIEIKARCSKESLHFENIDQLISQLNVELVQWGWITNVEHRDRLLFISQKVRNISFPDVAVNALRNATSTAGRLQTSEDSNKPNIEKDIEANAKRFYEYFPTCNNPLFSVVFETAREDPYLAIGFLSGIISQFENRKKRLDTNEQESRVSIGRVLIEGTFIANANLHTEMDLLASDSTKALNACLHTKSEAEWLIQNTKREIDALQDRISVEFGEVEKKKIELDSLRDKLAEDIRESIALVTAVDEWKAKATRHQTRSFWFGVTAAILVILSIFISSVLIVWEYPFTRDSIAPFIFLTTMYSLLVVSVIKLAMSNFHLHEDASERLAALRTYLSLKERGDAQDADRIHLLTMMFRAGSTGLIKDGGGSTDIVALLRELINSKAGRS